MNTLSSASAKPSEDTSIPMASARLVSMDAYRGFVMFLMMAEVLQFHRVADAMPGSGFWRFLAHHQDHVPWVGCSLHDLIQPSFSFLVGVALPFSIASRLARGQSQWRMTLHAFWRALVLILLGVFLRSLGQSQTNWTFEDTLTQIGLGYGVLFVLGFRPVRDQWIALGLILIGFWAAFALYPAPGPDFNYPAVGLEQGWPHLATGFAAHWNKNSNLSAAFDTWFLNLFSRERPFLCNGGGYVTLSFIPTLATMILGLIAGGVVRSSRSALEKMRWLATAGIIGLAAGWALGALGIFSGGWCFLLLAGFYAVIDVWGRKRWAFPLVVIGMNSIAAYCIAHLFEGFVAGNLKTHFGAGIYSVLGQAYVPLVRGGLVLLVFWLILYWMYRRKLFLRV
jgi:heparan-alpha-glucosaminide N-acetyltransferase